MKRRVAVVVTGRFGDPPTLRLEQPDLPIENVRTLAELRDRLPGMMTLISLAITVAFVFSLAVTFGFPGMALWWELATLVTIMLLGHWMEMRSISQAQGALKELAKLLPATAERIMVVPNAVARTTAPNSQKSKYRHDISLSIQGLTCFFSTAGGLHS